MQIQMVDQVLEQENFMRHQSYWQVYMPQTSFIKSELNSLTNTRTHNLAGGFRFCHGPCNESIFRKQTPMSSLAKVMQQFIKNH